MTSLAQGVAAPEEYEAGDRKVYLYPLAFAEWGQIERWMRAEMIATGREACKDPSLSPYDVAEITREAFAAASRISIASEDAREGLLSSFSGMLRIVRLSLNKGNPELKAKGKAVTVESVAELVGDQPEALAAMVERIFALSFPEQYAGEAAKEAAEAEAKEKEGTDEENPMVNPPSTSKPSAENSPCVTDGTPAKSPD